MPAGKVQKILITLILLTACIQSVAATENCETGPQAMQKYGFDRILLEWQPSEINENTCEYYACDATQASIMLFKSIESNKTGEIQAFLLKDNYSDKFKQDFDQEYGERFFQNKEMHISNWTFKNSPQETGVYKIKIEETENPTISFELLYTLNQIDSVLKTKYQKNPLLKIPFDATLQGENKDYGTQINGEIKLNKTQTQKNTNGTITTIQTSEETTLKELETGILLEISENENSYNFKLNKATPTQITIDFKRRPDFSEGKQEIYYYLKNAKDHEANTTQPKLFEWQGENSTLPDYYAEMQIADCAGWGQQLKAGSFHAKKETHGTHFETITFLPEDYSFGTYCSLGNTKVSTRTYNGNEEFIEKAITAAEKQFKPEPIQKTPKLEHSLKQTIKEIEQQNTCVNETETGLSIKWNPEMFPEEEIKISTTKEAGIYSTIFETLGTITGFGSLSTPSNLNIDMDTSFEEKRATCGGYLGCTLGSEFPCCDDSIGICVECTQTCGCSGEETCSAFTNSCNPKENETSFSNIAIENMVVAATKKTNETYELQTASGEKKEIRTEELLNALNELNEESNYSFPLITNTITAIQNPSRTVCDQVILIPQGTKIGENENRTFWSGNLGKTAGGMLVGSMVLFADDATVIGILDDPIAIAGLIGVGLLAIAQLSFNTMQGRTIYIERPFTCPISQSIATGTGTLTEPDIEIGDGRLVKVGDQYMILIALAETTGGGNDPDEDPGKKPSKLRRIMQKAKLPATITVIGSIIAGSIANPEADPLNTEPQDEQEDTYVVQGPPQFEAIIDEENGTVTIISTVFKEDGTILLRETRIVSLSEYESYGAENAFLRNAPEGTDQEVQRLISTGELQIGGTFQLSVEYETTPIPTETLLTGNAENSYFSTVKREDQRVEVETNKAFDATGFFRYPIHNAFLEANKDTISSFADLSVGLAGGAPTTVEAKLILGEDTRVLATDLAVHEEGLAILETHGIEFEVHRIGDAALGEQFDAIRLANVTQSMTKSEVEQAIENIRASLKDGGILLGAKINADLMPSFLPDTAGEEQFILIKTPEGWEIITNPVQGTDPYTIANRWSERVEANSNLSPVEEARIGVPKPLRTFEHSSEIVRKFLISDPQTNTEDVANLQIQLDKTGQAIIDIFEVVDTTNQNEVTTFQHLQVVADSLISQTEAKFEISLDPELKTELNRISGELASTLRGKPIQPTLEVDQLVAVHRTNQFPENGVIKTSGTRTEETEIGTVPLQLRETIHFSINGAVTEHEAGSWTDRKFTIIVPLADIMENVNNLQGEDTWVFGNLELPPSAIILGDRESIQGKNPGNARAKIIETREQMNEEIQNEIRGQGYTVTEIGGLGWSNVESVNTQESKWNTPVNVNGYDLLKVESIYEDQEKWWRFQFTALAERLGVKNENHEETAFRELEEQTRSVMLILFDEPSELPPQTQIDNLAKTRIEIYGLVDPSMPAQREALQRIRTVTDNLISQTEQKFNIELDPALRTELNRISEELASIPQGVISLPPGYRILEENEDTMTVEHTIKDEQGNVLHSETRELSKTDVYGDEEAGYSPLGLEGVFFAASRGPIQTRLHEVFYGKPDFADGTMIQQYPWTHVTNMERIEGYLERGMIRSDVRGTQGVFFSYGDVEWDRWGLSSLSAETDTIALYFAPELKEDLFLTSVTGRPYIEGETEETGLLTRPQVRESLGLPPIEVEWQTIETYRQSSGGADSTFEERRLAPANEESKEQLMRDIERYYQDLAFRSKVQDILIQIGSIDFIREERVNIQNPAILEGVSNTDVSLDQLIGFGVRYREQIGRLKTLLEEAGIETVGGRPIAEAIVVIDQHDGIPQSEKIMEGYYAANSSEAETLEEFWRASDEARRLAVKTSAIELTDQEIRETFFPQVTSRALKRHIEKIKEALRGEIGRYSEVRFELKSDWTKAFEDITNFEPSSNEIVSMQFLIELNAQRDNYKQWLNDYSEKILIPLRQRYGSQINGSDISYYELPAEDDPIWDEIAEMEQELNDIITDWEQFRAETAPDIENVLNTLP